MKRNTELFPDFLGIGAPRAGTTWLWVNLGKHPNIWMPPRKELHYFDRSLMYPSPSHLACSSVVRRLFGGEKHNREYKIKLLKALYSNILQPSWNSLKWNWKYFFGKYNDRWYASLFKQGNDKVKGEITPAYSLLEESDVERIGELIPKVKIIYLLRNPIDRAWSTICYREKTENRTLTSLPLPELANIMIRPSLLSRSNYLKTLSIWRKYFPERQIFIGFYEELQHRPKELLLRIFEFLGVSSAEKYITDSAFNRVNASPQKKMPRELKIYLAKRYNSQIKELSSMIGGNTIYWMRDVKSTLQITEETAPQDG